MTGMEWAVCDDPRRMVEALRRRGRVSDRQWRLFVAAFWRWQADNLPSGREDLIQRTEAMENFAETGRLPRGQQPSNSQSIIFFAIDAARAAALTADFPLRFRAIQRTGDMLQANLLRDLFGNPFQSLVLEPRWQTSDVQAVARGIYDDRAFERMPILADALMDAGCEHETIIGHCRQSGGHIRGCWVLDLVLGTE